MSALDDAAAASAYVIAGVQRRAGPRWLQGRRSSPLASMPVPPSLALVAEQRLYRVPEEAARALVAWAEGASSVELLRTVPAPRAVLALQARGHRCVSLLDEAVDPSPHEDGLAFAMHDLCHLAKFTGPAHHLGQVGFFAAVHEAMTSAGWARLEGSLDERWAAERDHVIADMNGSAVFLFLTLKTKLELAIARTRAGAPAEERTDAVRELAALLDLRGAAADAALRVSSRADAKAYGPALLAAFERAGRAALERGGQPTRLTC